jgi:hypothetical protein
MRLQAFTVLALSCALAPFATAQQGGAPGKPLGHPPKPGQSTELPATAESVKPSDSVITLDGACKTGDQKGCVAMVSREQFEQLANAVKPAGMTTDARRLFASQYGKSLAFADQARALGIENEPRFKEIMAYVKDQLLGQALIEHYSDEYSNPSDQKIEEYYKANSRKYLQADLQRVIIPSQPASADITKPTEAEQKAYIEKVRQQWVSGADPVTLQKEALARMGLMGSAPDVNLKEHAPGMIPPEQESVFQMKPGEISQPFVDTGAAYLYKMVSEKEKPLSEVKTQIAKTIHDQMMREKIQELSESVKEVLNEAYFGPEKKPESPATGTLAPQQNGEPSANSNPPQPASPQK